MRRGVFERRARRGAHQAARIVAQLLRTVVVDGHRPLALPHRLLQRAHQPFGGIGRYAEAVDHQIDRVDLIAVELHARRDFADLAVDAGIDIPLLGQLFEQFAVVPLAALHHGSEQGDPATVEIPEDQIGDLLVRVMHHLLARGRRIGARRACVEQTQEIVDLRNGPDRRTGILVGGLLLDSHHGAQSRDLVHIGALHRPDELTRVGRERLHVAALPLGIDRVEGQRRFARAAESGDYHEFATRNFEVYVLQVVNPRAEYLDAFLFHRIQ